MPGSISPANHGPEITSAALPSLKSDFTSAPDASCGIQRFVCSESTQRNDSAMPFVSNEARPVGSNSSAPKPKRIGAWK
jgi:hypothetical protein